VNLLDARKRRDPPAHVIRKWGVTCRADAIGGPYEYPVPCTKRMHGLSSISATLQLPARFHQYPRCFSTAREVDPVACTLIAAGVNPPSARAAAACAARRGRKAGRIFVTPAIVVSDEERDRERTPPPDPDEAPETPEDEPAPVPVKDPPADSRPSAPYVVDAPSGR
jgi:hypothetical protein